MAVSYLPTFTFIERSKNLDETTVLEDVVKPVTQTMYMTSYQKVIGQVAVQIVTRRITSCDRLAYLLYSTQILSH